MFNVCDDMYNMSTEDWILNSLSGLLYLIL
jgi:hypothetical protein